MLLYFNYVDSIVIEANETELSSTSPSKIGTEYLTSSENEATFRDTQDQYKKPKGI